MTLRHCKLWKYQHWRMCTKSRPSPCHPLCRFTIYPDWIPWNLHEAQEAKSIAHSNLSSALPFKKSIGFLMLAICHNPCGVQIAQILMLSLPLPIHLLDRLLDFGVTFSLGLPPTKKKWNIEIWKCIEMLSEEINASFTRLLQWILWSFWFKPFRTFKSKTICEFLWRHARHVDLVALCRVCGCFATRAWHWYSRDCHGCLHPEDQWKDGKLREGFSCSSLHCQEEGWCITIKA